ncbi:Peptidyl-tRNA hydrolase PTH2 [Arabidopsis thaliana x Arabidopsis arenosa]|uniref:Peptidyl-tRNA hydrolase PTH2 n=1 Tax=Arabidopsis thaliana x Arabidopsis arenosa TaxID=1240361 RepID=A0A8T1YVU4_9BRAS|nr:Peptidyl-tRNA hydrolase PTH2 [Arabidopsis thaliana x Arabidopsis arenosa]
MASAVVSAAFRLPIITRRLSAPAPRIRFFHSTIGFSHLRRITTAASSMSQQTEEIGAVVDASSRNDENSVEKPDDVVVQYVVLRRDLIDSWPLGSVVTQGCHASVAAICSFKDDPVTLQYCDPQHIDSMHKVTLEVKGETQMMNLAEKLKSGGISHKLWMEQPENIPTCIATKPYHKSQVSSFFKKLKLCK